MWNPFRSGPPKPMPPPVSFPWAAAGSAVIALVGLFITNGGIFVPVLIAATLLPGVWTRPRLDDEPVWVARLVLMGLVMAVGLSEPPPDMDGFVDPHVMGLFGQVCAAEVVILLWRRRAPTQWVGTWTGFWTGFVFLAACNTFDERWVRWLAPPCLLLAVLAARGGRARPESGTPAPARRGTTLALAGAFLLTLLIGAASYTGVYLYRGPLNALSMKLLAAQRGAGESTGMSAQPQLGATFNLRGSLQRVLRIEGPLGDPHLRGQAFDEYRGGRWYPNESDRHLKPVGDALHPQAPGTATRVIHLNDDGGFLFAPLNAVGLRSPMPLTWDAQHGGPILTTAPAPFVSEYMTQETMSSSPLSGSPMQQNVDAAERVRCLSIPTDLDPSVVRLARRVLEGYADPADKMHAVEAYLMSHHAYSLTYTPSTGDPVSGFILSDKPAHCEYFAAAAALLLRCAGVPTRYVTGYYAHESAGVNVTVVRQQDAHAWCEAYAEGTGWMTVDATPGGGRPDQTAAPAPTSRKWGEWASDQIAAFRRWVDSLSVRDRWMLVGILAVILIVPQIIRARRRRQGAVVPEWTYAAPDAEELREMAVQFMRFLTRAGVPCPPGRPWAAHLSMPETVSALTLGMPRRAREFVHVYSRLRFGPLVNAEDVRTARTLLGELDKEIDRAAAKETSALP